MALKSITVGELIKRLQEQDEQALVIVTADYGDRAHTEQALPLHGECTEVSVRETAYSSSGFAISDDGDEDDEANMRDQDPDGFGVTYLVIR